MSGTAHPKRLMRGVTRVGVRGMPLPPSAADSPPYMVGGGRSPMYGGGEQAEPMMHYKAAGGEGDYGGGGPGAYPEEYGYEMGGMDDPRFWDDYTRGGDDGTSGLKVWLGAGAILLVFAIAAAGLGLGIWAAVVASDATRRLDDAKESGLLLRGDPTERGHTPQWDPDRGGWFPGHTSVRRLEDVRLGSEERPLAEGDILRWERGRVVNARDRALEQELGHHLDTRFVRPQTGDVPIYNGNSSQWRNVPLGAMLAMRALGDVELLARDGVPRDGARLEYNAKRGKWVERMVPARAWLRFCAPPEGAHTMEVNRTWGALEPPLASGRWVPVRPVSPMIGVYTMDLYTQGGLRASRKNAALITRRHNDHHGRPTTGGGAGGPVPMYLVRAIVTTRGFPTPGAWGFLVGNEPSPPDGGFATWPEWLGPHQEFPENPATAVRQANIETVRRIGPDTYINLAYFTDAAADLSAPQQQQPLVQCMMVSVEEL